MQSRLAQRLEQYRNLQRISLAMPGHKGGRGIPDELRKHFFSYDVTELSDTDSLYESEGALKEAQERAARFYQSRETLFLVNGSTSGIFIMLLSCCHAGDRVLVSRHCHQSVIHACTVFGLVPVYLESTLIPGFEIPDGISPAAVEHALKEEKVSAVLITSPNYYGVASDVAAISEIVHRYGIPLLADEAHGAHFAASEKIFPKSAVRQGADMVVQSAHKTLAAMNQTAFLHICSDRVDKERVHTAAKMLQTSSPSYAMLATADEAREALERNGAEEWGRVLKACETARKLLSEVVTLPKFRKEFYDPCRLVIPVIEYDLTGFSLAERLRCEDRIDVEMADTGCVVLLPSPSNSTEEIVSAANAVVRILKTVSKREKHSNALPPIPETVLSPREAFEKSGIWMDWEQAIGRISKNTVVIYPPGTPVIVLGERISRESISAIQRAEHDGAEVTGIRKNQFYVVEES